VSAPRRHAGEVLVVTRTFTQADFDATAALTGDDNPIHVDPGFAAATRFGRTLAHGMMLYGVVWSIIGTELFPGGAVELEHALRFPGPTFTDEPMSFRLEVKALDAEAGIAEVHTEVRRPNEELSCEVTSTVQLPRSS